MSTFLTFANLVAAQNRSHAQAISNGCDPNGVTQFWWMCGGGPSQVLGIVPPTALQALIVVNSTGFYGQSGLSGPEVTALQTVAQISGAGWNVPVAITAL